MKPASDCLAFADDRCIATGSLDEVARAVKAMSDARPHARLLVFNKQTSAPIEIDCRGSVAEVLARVAQTAGAANANAVGESASDTAPVEEAARSGPGRPRLGVVAREVTLLPRHWDWLASQPGGASVALRKLVEQARRASQAADRKRAAQDGQGLGEVLLAASQGLPQLGVVAEAQQLGMVLDDAHGQVVRLGAGVAELEQEAFLDREAADAAGVEVLEDLQHLVQLLQADAQVLGQLLPGGFGRQVGIDLDG